MKNTFCFHNTQLTFLQSKTGKHNFQCYTQLALEFCSLVQNETRRNKLNFKLTAISQCIFFSLFNPMYVSVNFLFSYCCRLSLPSRLLLYIYFFYLSIFFKNSLSNSAVISANVVEYKNQFMPFFNDSSFLVFTQLKCFVL